MRLNDFISDVCQSWSYHDSLGQRIAATVVVVDAVVGDLFSNLTANRAQDYNGPRQAEQPHLGGLGVVVVQDDALVLHLPHVPSLFTHLVYRFTKAEYNKSSVIRVFRLFVELL